MLQPCQYNLPHRVRSDIMLCLCKEAVIYCHWLISWHLWQSSLCSAPPGDQTVPGTTDRWFWRLWAGLGCFVSLSWPRTILTRQQRWNYYESLQVNHPTTPTTHWKLKRPRVWMSSRIRTCEIVRLWDGDISVCLTMSGHKWITRQTLLLEVRPNW